MPDTPWRDSSRAELADGSCPDCGSPVAGGHTASCETWISRSQAAKLTAEAVAAVERPLRAHIDTLTAAADAFLAAWDMGPPLPRNDLQQAVAHLRVAAAGKEHR